MKDCTHLYLLHINRNRTEKFFLATEYLYKLYKIITESISDSFSFIELQTTQDIFLYQNDVT